MSLLQEARLGAIRDRHTAELDDQRERMIGRVYEVGLGLVNAHAKPRGDRPVHESLSFVPPDKSVVLVDVPFEEPLQVLVSQGIFKDYIDIRIQGLQEGLRIDKSKSSRIVILERDREKYRSVTIEDAMRYEELLGTVRAQLEAPKGRFKFQKS